MKSFLLYLSLVGVPVFGVSMVLRSGRDLRAPVSFGGGWQIQAWPDSVCLATSDPDTLHLVVEQSGPVLQIRFARGTKLVGRVEGDSFSAAGRGRVTMKGRRVLDGVSATFLGLVSGAPCPAAQRTRVRGTRQQLPAGLTGH